MIDTGPNGPKGPHRFVSFKLDFISAVPRPAQAPAKAVCVYKRAPDSITSPPPALSTKPSETPAMDPIKRLAAVLALTATQFDYFKSIQTEAAQDTFLGQPDAGKNVEVNKALEADPVVCEVDGVKFRKSADPVTLMLAQGVIAARKAADDQKVLARASVLKAEAASLFANLPITEGAGIELLSIVEDHCKNADYKAEIKKMLAAKGANFGQAGKQLGANIGRVNVGKNGNDGETAAAKIKKGAQKIAVEKKISLDAAYSEFLATEEGQALSQEHEDARDEHDDR